MERNQFTFYRSYYEALKHLPKRDRAEVLMAVISYALDEVEPSLSGVPLSVFTLIKPTLDTGRNKAKNRQNKTKTKREQNGNEGEREKEREEEKEGEREYEGEDDSLAREAVAAVMSAYMDKINPTPSQSSLDELSSLWQEKERFECCMTDEDRDNRVNFWHKAVSRTLCWMERK